MRIESIRVAGDELILKTSDPDARRIAYNFKAGDYELKKVEKPRSKDANRYCWALCEEIARAVGIPKEDVYRRNIRDAGVFTPVPILNEAVEEYKRKWESRGLGWFVDVVDDSKIKGYKLVFTYFGSSSYTTSEMARLIDNIIQDAKAVGLDVISEREKSLLLEEWGK